jgi:hypothetical protein
MKFRFSSVNRLIILCFILFFSSLAIPRISSLFGLFLPLIDFALKLLKFPGYLRINNYLFRNVKILTSIVLLLLFVILNYTIGSAYEIEIYSSSYRNAVMIINFMYIVGILIDYKKLPMFPINFIIVNLSLYLGGILWVFLSVGNYVGFSFNAKFLVIQEREVPSFWKEGISEAINGPTLDMYSYLGVSLIGLIVFGFSDLIASKLIKAYQKIFLLLALILCFLLSLYSSLALGARTPIVVIIVSLIANYIILNLSFTKKQIRNIIIILISITTLLIIQSLFIEILQNQFTYLADMNLLARFEKEGLDTSRYQTWLDVITQIWDFPWGGREIYMKSSFAHNIWLDTAYDTGLIPMLLLLCFHFLQIQFILKFLRSNLPKILKSFTLCSCIAFLAAFLQAPVIQGHYVYFAISCFFFGSVIRVMSIYNCTKNTYKI